MLPDALRERGAEVDVLALYETVAEPLEAERDRRGRRAPTTSPSPPPRPCASSLEAAGADALAGPRLVSIGPVTSAALREHGLEPDVEADPHTPDGLVDARTGRREKRQAHAAPDHLPLRLRAGGRVRRRLPRA